MKYLSSIKEFVFSGVAIGVITVLLLNLFITIAVVLFMWRDPDKVIEFVNLFKPTVTPVPLQITGVGILGDSQSDEYQADDRRGGVYYSTTRNWIEQLAEYRKLPLGDWGEWEEPRRTGYAYNFSRSAATAESMLATGQHTLVADEVRKGNVNFVIIYIGANDFAPFLTATGYQAIYDGSLSDAEVLQKVNRFVADVTTAVDTIQKEKTIKMLLIKIPDWGKHRAVQIGFPYPDQRNRVTEAINLVNTKLEQLAKERNIATVDPNEFYAEVARKEEKGKVIVGNVSLDKIIPSNSPRSVFLDDGIHAGSIYNGLFANYIIRNLNSKLGTQIKEFSTEEIVRNAGL